MSILLKKEPTTLLATQNPSLKSEFDQILTLRTSSVLDLPLNRAVGHDQKEHFQMFGRF